MSNTAPSTIPTNKPPNKAVVVEIERLGNFMMRIEERFCVCPVAAKTNLDAFKLFELENL